MKAISLFLLIVCHIVSLSAQTPHDHTEEEILEDIDGNIYPTTTIGDQVWMAENLRVTKYNDGSEIPLITDKKLWRSTESGAYCWYKNDSTAYADEFGALYNLNAVYTDKLCPNGWHVPKINDWKYIFFANLNSVYYNLYSVSMHTIKFDADNDPEKLRKVFPCFYIDSLVKDTSMFNKIFEEYLKVPYNPLKIAPLFQLLNGKYWSLVVLPVSSETYHSIDAPNFVLVSKHIAKEDVNKTNFSALPGGFRGASGNFKGKGSDGWWHCSDAGNRGKGICIFMSANIINVETCSYMFIGVSKPTSGMSVRCVKN